MPPFNQAIENLLQGVSQQASYLRMPSQCEQQINGWSIPANGMGKRPPLVWKKTLSVQPSNYTGAFVHTINRDADDRFRVIIANGDLQVFDEDGVEETVNFPDGKAYLSATNPNIDFRAATNADTTVIANRNTTTAKGTTTSDAQAKEALLHVADSEFEVVYRVKIDNVQVSYTTPSGSDPTDRDQINTQTIAGELQDAINGDATLGPLFTATRFGSTLHIVRKNGADFTIEADDGLGGDGLNVIKGSVQIFSELPPAAPDGTILEVRGDPSTEFDNYWVKFDAASGNDVGVWEETVAPGELTEFDPSTMPHVLIRGGVAVDSLVAQAGPDPEVDAAAAGTDIDDGWSSAQNTAAPENGDVSIQNDGGAAYSNLEDANGTETTYTVYYDVEVPWIPGLETTISVWTNDGPTSTSWTQVASKKYVYGDGDIANESLSFVATMSANWDLKIQMDHDVVPSGEDPDGLTKLIAHGEDHATQPGVQYTVIGSDTTVNFKATDIYPEGTVVTLTINGNDVTHTVAADTDDTGADVATAIQPDADAEPNITATVISSGVLKIEDSTGTPTVSVSTDYDNTKVLIANATIASVAVDELVGMTLTNSTDGSSATITSNTTRSISASAGLTGGTDNDFDSGDVCTVNLPSSQWVFKQADWDARTVGTETLNPFPSFVGLPINEVFFWKNRFGVCADENVILTQAGDLFNFFRDTAIQLLDSDPIDVTANDTKVSVLHGMVHWNKAAIFYSDQSQFILSGKPLLTPSTAKLEKTTEFESTLRVRPYVAGRSIFFAKNESGSTRVWEYFPDISGRADVNDAENVTSHTPTYLDGAPIILAGSPSNNILAVLCDGDQSKVYIYKTLRSEGGRTKVQSSWSRWDFGLSAEILSVDFIGDTMGLVVKYEDGVALETIPIDEGYLDQDSAGADLGYTVHLDRRVFETDMVSVSYDAGADETTFTLPYEVPDEGTVYALAAFTDTVDQRKLRLHDPLTHDPSNRSFGFDFFDNGGGTGTPPSTDINPLKLQAIQVGTGGGAGSADSEWKAINAKVDLTSGLAVSSGIGVFNNMRVSAIFYKAWNHSGPDGGGPGIVLRSNDHRADPDDNTEQADDGDYIRINLEHMSSTLSKIQIRPVWATNPTVIGFPHEWDNIPVATDSEIEVGVDIVDDQCTPWYATTPGGTKVFGTAVDLTFGQAPTAYSMNDADHDSFGVYIQNKAIVDGIRDLTVAPLGGGSTICFKAVNTDTGAELTVESRDGLPANQFKISGDQSSTKLMAGLCYDLEYTFSRFHRYTFSQDGQPTLASSGRTQCKYLELDYTTAREFDVEVNLARPKDAAADTRTYSFSDATVGGVDGIFRSPLMGRNDSVAVTIRNDSPWQSWFTRGSWDGEFKRKVARR